MKTLSESNQREREIEGKSRSSLCQILLKKKCTKNIERIRLHCNEKEQGLLLLHIYL